MSHFKLISKTRLFFIAFTLLMYGCKQEPLSFRDTDVTVEMLKNGRNFENYPLRQINSTYNNVSGISMYATSIQSISDDDYPHQILFVDPVDTSNKLTLRLNNYFPYTEKGIQIRGFISGSLNSVKGDPKFIVKSDFDSSVCYYRNIGNDSMDILLVRLDVTSPYVIVNKHAGASWRGRFPRSWVR
ncbi:MAG: hypothetical protein KG003_14045 [Bacteroidetes bacterium]|nr:hypothetical protein [Bacteroidota bacterium]